MVNLLKFKPLADYDDVRSNELTGREAYEVYEARGQEAAEGGWL